jgi:hypothetical protein
MKGRPNGLPFLFLPAAFSPFRLDFGHRLTVDAHDWRSICITIPDNLFQEWTPVAHPV